jgi:aromatic-L-amino-acid/L-tryptophan decarboxylase
VSPDEFREAGHRLVDWIADFRDTLEDRPVRASVEPGWVRSRIAGPPAEPEPLERVLADLESTVLPGLSHFQHPSYFAFFPANASLASVLGDLASSGLGVLGLNWESSPALTELEEAACGWFADLLNLPDPWRGTTHDTASTSCLVALICARERAGGDMFGQGLAGAPAPLAVYCSDEAHSSVRKAALLAGFGLEHLRTLPTTAHEGHVLDPEALGAAIDEDLRRGRVPAAVVSSIGTTGVGAVDPTREIAEVATEHRLWHHIDAAMAGSAAFLPEMAHLFDGIDLGDSLSINPHKWLGTVFDVSMFFVKDPDGLQSVMSSNPSYLRTHSATDVTQFRDWGIPLGRRFRALKLWFHLRLDGLDAIRARLRRDIDNARWLADQVGATEGWTVVAPVNLQTVCVRHEPPGLTAAEGDAHTLGWVGAINDSGAAYLTPAVLDGRWMVRVSIGAEPTERRHIEALWQLMRSTAEVAHDHP